MRKINKIKIYINGDDKSKMVRETLINDLISHGFKIVDKDYDLAISIGGDGTFLKMIHDNEFNSDIYYVGINSGTLGFLQEIDLDKTSNFINRLLNNEFNEEHLSVGKVLIKTSTEIYAYNFLNEIVIRKNNLGTLEIPVFIDGELLENFTGDGLLASTSTGSTAYNLSLGGAIVYNRLKSLSLTPIAPINNRAYRTLTNSFVLPIDSKIELKTNNDLLLMIDGKNKKINNVINIEITIDNKDIKCLRMNDFHFVKVVNTKLLK